MKFIKDYSAVLVVYFLVILYVAVVGNVYVTILFLLILFSINLYIYQSVRNSILKDKEVSVNSLLNKLDKTKKQSEETYKHFLSLSKTIGSGVFMVDVEGDVSFSNKDVENYFGLDMNNINYSEMTVVPQLYKFVNEAYLIEEYMRKLIEFDDRFYELTSTPLFEGDMFGGMLVLVHDITEVKNAVKFQKRFTADVSHELKTPLAAIKGFSEIMMRDTRMAEENRSEFIGLINKESERMEIILSDLMTISKLDRLDYEMEMYEHDIKQVVDEALSVLKTKFDEKNLTKDINVEACNFIFDKFRITQVLLNIMKNAINYTDNGFVNVDGYKKGKNYIIKISDSGIGIKKENYENVFKRFYRVDKARSRDTGGSGLGLSISKNVILKHRGTIFVESEENKGSTFTISLPIKE